MKRPLNDSTGKKRKSNSGTENSRKQPWSPEEDHFLVEEVSKMESKNWKIVCKRMNKTFKTFRRTSKDCEQRWQHLSSDLTLSEELLVLLSFYRGTLGTAAGVLDGKIDVNEYVRKLVERARDKAKDLNVEVLENLPPLAKLQLLVCIDLALNPADEVSNEPEIPQENWLGLAQCLIKPKEKMTKEAFHKLLEKVVAIIEDKIYELADMDNGFEEIMHERKDNPSQLRAAREPACLIPLIEGGGYYILAGRFYPRPPPNNC